jgi:hypothetical protein
MIRIVVFYFQFKIEFYQCENDKEYSGYLLNNVECVLIITVV